MIASRYSVRIQDVWDVCYVARYDIQSPSYHTKADELASRLGSRFEPIEDEVLGVIAATPRSAQWLRTSTAGSAPIWTLASRSHPRVWS